MAATAAEAATMVEEVADTTIVVATAAEVVVVDTMAAVNAMVGTRR